MLKFLKKIIPLPLINFYHRIIVQIAAFYYGFPGKKLKVIGVTGTTGKSTVVNLIAQILEEAGFKVGLTSTFNFKIGKHEWLNKTKMTMLGRFQLQRFLKEMLKEGCTYAVIETSSEGLVQNRHKGLEYQIAVFTNLFPEHIESHGSFENYKKAKGILFKSLERLKNKKTVSVVNLDDLNSDYFLGFKAKEKYGYTLREDIDQPQVKIIKGHILSMSKEGTEFECLNQRFKTKLLGEGNVYNCLAAICVGLSQNIKIEIIKKALAKIENIPGRLEFIKEDQNFDVIVDYAHEPKSLESTYKIIKDIIKPRNLIAVLGAAGGGRDKWKRPVLGKLAARYADYIILTNEDPYDEDPFKIIEEVYQGIKETNFPLARVEKIIDRKEAIKKAVLLATKNDAVVITGKGCEQWIMGPRGKKIPWDDREIVKSFLRLK